MAGEGMYLGIGGGYSFQTDIHAHNDTDFLNLKSNGGGLVAGTLGFKFDQIPLRMEFEGGYARHDLDSYTFNGTKFDLSGNTEIISYLGNLVYDWQIAPDWALSLGGGVGVGTFHINAFDPTLSTTFGAWSDHAVDVAAASAA